MTVLVIIVNGKISIENDKVNSILNRKILAEDPNYYSKII
jgi:hypothetical protein